MRAQDGEQSMFQHPTAKFTVERLFGVSQVQHSAPFFARVFYGRARAAGSAIRITNKQKVKKGARSRTWMTGLAADDYPVQPIHTIHSTRVMLDDVLIRHERSITCGGPERTISWQYDPRKTWST